MSDFQWYAVKEEVYGFKVGDKITAPIVSQNGTDEIRGKSVNVIGKMLKALERKGQLEKCLSPAEEMAKEKPESLFSQNIKAPEFPEETPPILKDPQLLTRINREFDKKVVGEYKNRTAILLNACGMFVENNNIASYNLCLNSTSGAGKDFVCKRVLEIFPRHLIVMRSRISPTAFTYWHNSEFEPEWSWDNKACLLSDISDGVLNHESFKLMCSDGNSSTMVVKQRAVDILIIGKPVMFITTASGNPNNEMLRRFPFLELDETTNQTQEIKKRQAKNATLGHTDDYDLEVIDALSKLRRVRVKIPFAEQIVDSFPQDHIIMRTHFARLLDYIKASAALFQFQREKDAEGFILATPEDYDNAIIPLAATTSNIMMIPLSKKLKKLLEVCEKMGDFCVADIEPHTPFISQSNIYEALAKLQEFGFLTSESRTIEDKKKPVRYYQFIKLNKASIPSWAEIQSCRKSGIKGIGEIIGISGIKGNNGLIPAIPLIPAPNAIYKWPKWDDDALVHLPCVECDATPSNTGPDGKPYCYGCWGQKDAAEEEVK